MQIRFYLLIINFMLRFCDTNQKLVKKVDTLFKNYDYNSKFFGELKAIHGDIFKEKEKNGGRICTASNPSFNMAGGLDLAISKKFEVENPKEFYFNNDIFYLITVDENLKSSKKIIQRALCGVLCYRNKDLIITGIGTGIGGLSDEDFIDYLDKILIGNMSGANMSGADMSDTNMRRANMSDTNMSGANMRRANMSDTNMSDTNMSGANMSDTNMSGANMRRANMSDTNMRGANMRNTNMRDTNMSGANMSDTNMSGADMRDTNMSGANMSGADMSDTNMRRANMSDTNMRDTNMSGANMSGADMRRANMSDTNMSGANMSANLSQTKGIKDMSKWFSENFKNNTKGYIVYKAIGNTTYNLNQNWKIKKGEYLTENVNFNPTFECGCGVNFGTMDYIYNNYKEAKEIWECLIEFQDLISTVIPYDTDGKGRCGRLKLIRCGRLKLIKKLK
jgi:uncharacterized protein YjbI with pentapeptide repeats